jgi:hypothetical protein
MSKSRYRELKQLLEPGFAEGYDAFRELVDYGSNLDEVTVHQRVWLRLFELISVAMVEGLNRVEEEFEIEPSMSVIELWSAAGSALGTINAQAFSSDGRLAVRREMIAQFKEGYDKTIKAVVAKGSPS